MLNKEVDFFRTKLGIAFLKMENEKVNKVVFFLIVFSTKVVKIYASQKVEE